MRFQFNREPKPGEQRTVIKFAFLPVVISTKAIVWLEKYEETQQFIHSYTYRSGGRWVMTDRKLL